jgi:hypothetical protein
VLGDSLSVVSVLDGVSVLPVVPAVDGGVDTGDAPVFVVSAVVLLLVESGAPEAPSDAPLDEVPFELGAAHATPGVIVPAAVPIPNATASAPTRPT